MYLLLSSLSYDGSPLREVNRNLCVFVCMCMYVCMCLFACACDCMREWLHTCTYSYAQSYTSDSSTHIFASSPFYSVTLQRIVNYIDHLSPKWELLGYKLAVETTVRNLRESPISNNSKCMQVVEAWLESASDVSWHRFLTVLKEMNMMRTVSDIIEQEKLNLRFRETAKVIHQVK